jgi:hypothetical protein
MTLEFTQPLKEMSTSLHPGGEKKGGQDVQLNISQSFEDQFSTKCGSLNNSNPLDLHGLLQG